MWFGQSLLSTSYKDNANTVPTTQNNNTNINNSNTNNKNSMTKTISSDEMNIPNSQSYDSLSNLDIETSDVKSTTSSSSSFNYKTQTPTNTNGSVTSGSNGGEQYDTIRIGTGSSAIITLEESTKERTNFYTKLKNPKAIDIRKSLLNFVNQFSNNGPSSNEEQGHIIITYTRELEHWILSHPLWPNATEPEIEGIRDGIEKYIMSKLFHCTFLPARLGGLEPTEGNIISEIGLIPTEEDLKLFKHITVHGFIEPQHLDIQNFITSNEQRQNLAISELRKINTYKTPRDKMVCVYNCCRVLFRLLKAVNNNNPSGADEFLPLLIYVVLKANPLMLKSNITYVCTFRDQSRMMTEIACYFTHLVSAVTFIENITTPVDLTIDESEFYRLRDKFELELPLKLNSEMLKRLNYKPPSNHQLNGTNTSQPTTIVNNNNINNIKSPNIPQSPSSSKSNIPTLQPNSRGHSRHSSSNSGNLVMDQNNNLSTNSTMVGSPAGVLIEQQLQLDSVEQLEKRFEFLNCQSDDIKIGQISKLLEDYKKLVIENNILKSKINQQQPLHQQQHQQHHQQHYRHNSNGNQYYISEPPSLSTSPALSRNPSWIQSSVSLPISPNLISNTNLVNGDVKSNTPKPIEEEDEVKEKEIDKVKQQDDHYLLNGNTSPTVSSSSLLD